MHPTAAVVLTVASGDTGEATVAPAQLTFDAETWDQPQAVTVTGADDDVADGDIAFAVTTSVASDDPVYADFAVDDIDAVNQDDDVARHRRLHRRHDPTEAGGSVAVTVTLLSRPTANVQIVPASSARGVQVDEARLTFTPDTWNTPQALTLTGVDD
ncbi:MAG: hypothetical protein R2838_17060 [Caldilineaceae bacterium]